MGGCTSSQAVATAAAPATRDVNADAPVSAKVANAATDGDQTENKATQAAAVAAGVVTAGVVVTAALNNVDYLDKMQSLMQQFEDMAALADSPAVDMMKEAFAASEDVLRLVVNLAVPPPGGQIIAAAITITGLVIKGAMNVQACKELAIRCNRLVQAAFPHQDAIDRMGHDSVKNALQQLLGVCQQVEAFIRDVLEQQWWKKMLTVGETSREIKDLEKEMESVRGALLTATTLAGYTTTLETKFEVTEISSIVRKMDEQAKKAQGVIDKYGGYEKMCGNKEGMQELIGATGGTDGVMLHMHQQQLDELRDLSSFIKARAADEKEGPHQIIHHETLKAMWKNSFGAKEHVDWNDFWGVFPGSGKELGLAEDEIKILTNELKDDNDKTKLRLACDVDSDDKISATELQVAFPARVDLVEQVQYLKSRPARKGDHDDIPTLPRITFGRDKEIDEVYQAIHPEGPARVALILGGPGEGKLTIAGEVARKLYYNDLALGGIWRIKMADVTSGRDLLSRFISGIVHIAKPDDKESGGESTFKRRLNELARRGTNMYVLIDDCECVTSLSSLEKDAKESKAWSVLFDELVIQMLKEVPKMKLIIISRDPISSEIENAARAVHKLNVKPLDLEWGETMILESRPSLTAAQASRIALNYDRNPLMLSIVASALKSSRMSVEQALDAPSLGEVAGNKEMQKDLMRVELSIMRTLDMLPGGHKTLLLKMALLLPGTFNLDMLKKLLDLTNSKAKTALDDFRTCGLLEEVKKNEFRITSMLREAANKISRDEAKAADNGIGRSEMEVCWKTYTSKCCEMVQLDFKKYKSTPGDRYPIIVKNKPFVQQALRLALTDSDMAKLCLQPLMDMLSLLPYLGYVHDSALVQEVCQALYGVVEDDEEMEAEQKTYLGLCKAVEAHFAPGGTADEMNHVQRVADEVVDLLEDCTGAKAHLVLAMALRRKGVVLRDMGKYDLSVAALQSAKFNVESTGLGGNESVGTEQVQLELILDLTELAGTLDYQGDMAQGEPIAEEALSRARRFYGQDTLHPVTAQCLTTYGYFLKGKGVGLDKDIAAAEAKAAAASSAGQTEEACLATEEAEGHKAERRRFHEQAVQVNMEALGMRQEVLGKEHLEVALSYQQAAISLVPLGKFQEAQEALTKSLDIRQMGLKEFHMLIFNTHRELAALFKAWAKPDEQIKALREQVRVGCGCFGKEHKKVVAAAEGLAAALKANGLEE